MVPNWDRVVALLCTGIPPKVCGVLYEYVLTMDDKLWGCVCNCMLGECVVWGLVWVSELAICITWALPTMGETVALELILLTFNWVLVDVIWGATLPVLTLPDTIAFCPVWVNARVVDCGTTVFCTVWVNVEAVDREMGGPTFVVTVLETAWVAVVLVGILVCELETDPCTLTPTVAGFKLVSYWAD